MATKQTKTNGSSTKLGFEEKLWQAADKLRGHLDAAEYKHIVLGLIFLKYISDAFNELYDKLAEDEYAEPEDRDEYKAENIFYVPPAARWLILQSNAKNIKIGELIDLGMDAIEKENPSLKGVLPKEYGKPALDKRLLGELIDLIGTIGLGDAKSRENDVLGRVYEYFLGQFANAEGKKGGQFYTPPAVVKVLVEMIEPYKGRVYDPCCGSGGMFVQSEKFIKAHEGKIGDISIYGHNWRGSGKEEYVDIPGFCKSASFEEIKGHGYVLTPGRYVGAEEVEDDGESFEEKMLDLTAKLDQQFTESAKLETMIRENLRGLGYYN